MFNLIVAGSRSFSDYALLERKLDHLLKQKTDVVIFSGMARGADLLAVKYAAKRKITVKGFHANWKLHGNRAGFIRNELMAEEASALVAFWDGKSNGTADMVSVMIKKGLPYRVIRF